jgi:hypothetical protein
LNSRTPEESAATSAITPLSSLIVSVAPAPVEKKIATTATSPAEKRVARERQLNCMALPPAYVSMMLSFDDTAADVNSNAFRAALFVPIPNRT